MTPYRGACLCGAVKIEVGAFRPGLHACHCAMCRAWTGSMTISVSADDDAVHFDGPVRVRRTSDWAERAWCDDCGSSLWYRLTIPGQEHYALSAGVFPDALGQMLTGEIYIDQKPAGYALAGTHIRQTGAEVEAIWAAAAEGTSP